MLSRSRSFLLAPATVLALVLPACGTSPTEAVDTSTSRITSGRADDADGSVVWIVAEISGKTGYCSGVVVSPHVVLTAGHCSEPEANFSIFLGSDYSDTTAKGLPRNYVAVAEHHPHPEYNPKDNLHDVGVLVTAAPLPPPPSAINRDPLEPSDRGAPIRIVGFGQTAADDKTIGRRHEATTTLADYDATGLSMKGTPSFCFFDSGGPTFMTRGGAEVVVGIHSIVESSSCDTTAWDVRVDVHADFIDAFVAKEDPPGDAGAGGSAGSSGEGYGGGGGDADAPSALAAGASGCSIGASHGTSDAALALALAAGLGARRRQVRARRRRATVRRYPYLASRSW